jgi:drug/metabolite transporter (DMT)-like permease
MPFPLRGPRPPKARSVVLLVLVMLLWGSTYVVTKTGLGELPPMLFALLRFCVASLCLLPLALLRGGISALPRPRPWGTLVLMGLTGVGLYYVLFNLALTYTNASQGSLVQSSLPVVTAAMAVLWLHEKVTRRRLLGIALAVAGVLLIVVRSQQETGARAPLLGNALMLGTVASWGVYTMLAKRTAGLDATVVVAAITIIGTAMLAPAALIEAVLRGGAPEVSAESWLRIVYLGSVPSAGCFVLYSRALRDLDASQVGTFINLVPLVGVLSGVLVLGETVTPLAIVGGAMVLVGVWLSSKDTN